MNGVDFDPDKFELSKRDLLNIVGAIIKYWKKHTLQNFHFIAGAEAVQAGLLLTPDSVVRKFWNMMLKIIQQVQFENTIAQAMKNGETFAETLNKLTKKIEDVGLEAFLK